MPLMSQNWGTQAREFLNGTVLFKQAVIKTHLKAVSDIPDGEWIASHSPC